MNDLEDLRSDLSHVLDEIEQLVSNSPLPKNKDYHTRFEAERVENLQDIEEARNEANKVKGMDELTDILTWALQRLEEEEGKQRARAANRTPTSSKTGGQKSSESKSNNNSNSNSKNNTVASASTVGQKGEEADGNESLDVHPELVMGNTGWTIHAAPNGKAYWHHEITGESVWEEPNVVLDYRKQTEVDGWGVHPAPTGKPYWHNEITGESVWVEPEAMTRRRVEYLTLANVSFEQVRASNSKMQDSDDDDEDSNDDYIQNVVSNNDTKDTRLLRRQLTDTMAELEKSLVTIHDLTEDRDALVEALDNLSTESEDRINRLKMKLKRVKQRAKTKAAAEKEGKSQDTAESKNPTRSYEDENENAMEELSQGLETALVELQSEMEKNDRLQNAVQKLRAENKKLKKENGNETVVSPVSKRDLVKSPLKEQRKTFAVNDLESQKLAKKSASLLQSRMRGFLARKEFEKKVEEHLMDEIVIPDFSHLNNRRSGSDRGGRYTNDGYGRKR